MNPDQTIRSTRAGRRAAAIRDGRAEAGDATTQVIARQHTPAPWVVNPALAQVDAFGPHPQPVCRLLWPTGVRSEAETEANARLIAAAPSLLAAVRALLADAPANAHEDREVRAALGMANQAIVDVEGRRRCDECCGTGYMRLLSTHRTVPCTHCGQA